MHYTLQITLKERKPISERTIQIEGKLSFAQLAKTICELYGLSGDHLREFILKNTLCINHPEIDISTLERLDNDDPEISEILDQIRQLSASSYRLDDYFSQHQEIVFAYDFWATWTFVVTKTVEQKLNQWAKKIVLISWKGTYLVEDAGWPQWLKEYLDDYKRHKRDEDRRESRDEFTERLTPAMTKFAIKNHPKLT